MLRAIQGDSNTNVIATPSAVTMDNQEAELKVAQEVPFITGSFTNTGNTGNDGDVNPFTTVQRQEVGTILKITPQVNGGGALVQLKIELESSSLAGDSGDANSLITNKRTINTNVLIEDGGIVVLGGLIQRQRHSRRAARALPRPHPDPRRAVQDAQPPDATRPISWFSSARRSCATASQTADRDRREIQLHPRRADAPRGRQGRNPAAASVQQGAACCRRSRRRCRPRSRAGAAGSDVSRRDAEAEPEAATPPKP